MMASVGDIILRGGVPFRDGWDIKGPLAYMGFAAAEFLFGRNMWGIRVLELGLLGLACHALRQLDEKRRAYAGGTVAAGGLVLGFASLGWFHTAQPDGWVALLTTVAFVPLLTASGRTPARLAMAGVCVGACSLIKPFYALLGLVPLYLSLMDGATGRARFVRAGAVVAGAMLAPLVMLAWFAYRGGWHDLISVQLGYNLSALSASVSGRRLRLARAAWYALFASPALLAGALALWRAERRACYAVLLWLMLAVGCVALQGKFFIYQWIPVFAPVALLGGIGISGVLTSQMGGGRQALAQRAMKAATLLASFCLAAWLAVAPARDVTRWLAYCSGTLARLEYYDRFEFDQYRVGDQIRAADYIATHTRPGDAIVVFGNDATLGYLSGRRMATRFVYGMALTREVPGFRAAYRTEFMETIARMPPAFVVLGLPFEFADKERALREFPEFREHLQRNYHLSVRFGFLELWAPNQPL